MGAAMPTYSRRVGAAALAFAFATCAAGPDARGAERMPVGLADYFEVEVASDPQITPDGRRVAYVLTSPDLRTDRRHSSIRIVSTRDGVDTPIDAGATGDRLPRWSPEGDRLAFVRASGGANQLLIARPPGTPEVVAELQSAPAVLAWSPDGRRLAYLAPSPVPPRAPVASSPPAGATWVKPPIIFTEGGFQTATAMLPVPVDFHAYVVDAGPSSTPRQVRSASLGRALPYTGASLAWSRDGRRLLSAIAPQRDHWKNLLGSELYSIDVASGELRLLAAPTSTVRQVLVDGDGRIAFLAMDTARAGQYFDRRLYLGPGEGGPFEWIHSDLDRPVTAAAWAPDRQGLYAVYLDEGVGRLAWFGLDGKRRPLAETGGGDASLYTNGGSLTVARDGTIAFAFSDPTTPSEIALVRPGTPPRVLTRNNASYLAARVINPVDSLRYRAADGREDVHAWLIRPAHARPGQRLPVFVLAHGGQSADYGPDFDLDAQVVAAHGYLVVLPNYRGSGTYGRRFGTQPDYPVGADADMIGAVDALIAQGQADPERLFIAGGSGGGLVTAMTIGATGRFRAAAVWNAPLEWSTYVFEAATGPSTMYGTFAKLPWDAPDEYFRRSPYARVGNVTTPTLVTIGTSDRVTPISQSILYFNALQYRGVPSELLVFPDATHGIRTFPSHAMSHLAETLAWFARYGGPPLTPARLGQVLDNE
jgi:dipeptidyl aminopeptidase/acylaminoacyl peptidase